MQVVWKKMDATGGHQVKQSKPDSERQRPRIFSCSWKIDPKDKYLHKTNMVAYKLICRMCL
jgi:hypothetical protein